MIVQVKDTATIENSQIAKTLNGFAFKENGSSFIVTSSSMNDIPSELTQFIEQSWHFDTDIQISSNSFRKTKREININGNSISPNRTWVIAGPCSVESEEQINVSANFLKEKGLKFIRGGCYKPRTSPYSFQGLGEDGLKLIRTAADENELSVVTEVKDSSHVDKVIELGDVIQVGTKAMYDQGVLHACGDSGKPILLKRGFGSTIQEFVQAAEFIMYRGNMNVILCERGIRTFENKSRFTLDLTGVAWLKQEVNLPVFIDPSHAMGQRNGIADLMRASTAMGVEGLLVEVHPDPSMALSDAAQQLSPASFTEILESLRPVANAINRTIS